MYRHPVGSSNLSTVGYDPRLRVLEIEFHNGGVYRYSGVSQQVYDGLMGAGSKGQYFHAYIKGVYSYQRVS